MGEKMNRKNTASLSLGTIIGLFSLATACASGADDPEGAAGSSGKPGAGTTGGASASGGLANTGAGAVGGASSTAGSQATAGGSGGSTTAGPSVCDGKTRVLPLAEAFVDNFETATRFDGWYAFSDTTPANLPAIERLAGGALDTAQAAHASAEGIKAPADEGYGAGFGFNLVNVALENCLDLAAFDGISFWVKGSAGADNALKFQAVVPATQPATEMPPGDCTVVAKCFLHPAKTVTLTAEWQHVTIAFSDLVAPGAAWTGKILGFNLITTGPDYDASIDEITFYKGTAPVTPVTPTVAGEGGEGGAGG